MGTTAKRLGALSEEKLGELLELLHSVDSTELKLTLPESAQRSAVMALGMDPLEAQIRQVYFFDTLGLALNGAGVVARARRIQGRSHDSVVKLRPVVPAELPPDLRESKNLVVEVDAMPGGYICSASLKGKVGPEDVRAVAAGELPLNRLFSKQQRAFYAAHAPQGIELDDLVPLGPVFVLKLKFSPEGITRKLVAELWLYPDGSRILELSVRCPPSQAFDAAAELRAYLARGGVNLEGEQQTKTLTALEFFAGELGGVPT
jgi:hypothetical protein